MKKMIFYQLIFIQLLFVSCNGQQIKEKSVNKSNPIVGDGCDGCELMYIGMPNELHAMDTSPGWNEKGQKLIVSGTVFQLDQKTPAPNVIIYYWQTDNNGYYSPKPEIDERVKRHGHIRGWVKTDKNGKYTIRTIRPAPYPNDVSPAHIHLSIKEPDVANEYYTDEINFTDDKLLATHFKKYPQEKRGGSGIVKVQFKDSVQIATHDIVLGLNIPGYRKR
ncbi:protocatechuate 3,4-dioxygenase beta subunit [Flavobacterium sp. 28YEA47A]|uniref:dioxygenase family protein n=1 Tax=Flavobacterium sp. 28YEA47A TaxID=3156276 RepID=UPI00351519DA